MAAQCCKQGTILSGIWTQHIRFDDTARLMMSAREILHLGVCADSCCLHTSLSCLLVGKEAGSRLILNELSGSIS